MGDSRAVIPVIAGILIVGLFVAQLIIPSSDQIVYGQLSAPDPYNPYGQPIPSWVDQNFRWYGEGLIAQGELVNAIKYLIDEEIMVIDTPTASSGDFLQSDVAEKGIVIIDSIPSALISWSILSSVLEIKLKSDSLYCTVDSVVSLVSLPDAS